MGETKIRVIDTGEIGFVPTQLPDTLRAIQEGAKRNGIESPALYSIEIRDEKGNILKRLDTTLGSMEILDDKG